VVREELQKVGLFHNSINHYQHETICKGKVI